MVERQVIKSSHMFCILLNERFGVKLETRCLFDECYRLQGNLSCKSWPKSQLHLLESSEKMLQTVADRAKLLRKSEESVHMSLVTTWTCRDCVTGRWSLVCTAQCHCRSNLTMPQSQVVQGYNTSLSQVGKYMLEKAALKFFFLWEVQHLQMRQSACSIRPKASADPRKRKPWIRLVCSSKSRRPPRPGFT